MIDFGAQKKSDLLQVAFFKSTIFVLSGAAHFAVKSKDKLKKRFLSTNYAYTRPLTTESTESTEAFFRFFSVIFVVSVVKKLFRNTLSDEIYSNTSKFET